MGDDPSQMLIDRHHDPSRNSHDDRVVRHIAGDDSTGAYYAVVPYMHTWEDNGTDSYGNVIAYMDWAHDIQIGLPVAEQRYGSIMSDKPHSFGNEAAVSKRDEKWF